MSARRGPRERHEPRPSRRPADLAHRRAPRGATARVVTSEGDGALPLPRPKEASPPKRTWIKHEVIAGDLVSTVARRYGVTKKEIIRWNKLNAERPIIVTGRKLRVYARVVPLPRERHVHVVQPGDSWYGIARSTT